MPKSAVRRPKVQVAKPSSRKNASGAAAKRRSPRGSVSKRAKRAGTTRPSGKVSAIRAPMTIVHAFTRRAFHGNPAAVVLLGSSKLDSDTMQRIAAENKLSETAFVTSRPARGQYSIRWFTPATEVDLCGHATLAAAHTLWNHSGEKRKSITFHSASGKLPVEKRGDMIVLDFPARPARRTGPSRHLSSALGREPSEVYQLAGAGSTILAVFENKRDVHELAPDFAELRELDAPAVIVTAPGAGHDFVCRFFAPSKGIDEDPVTGSAHCTLIPYWASRLGRSVLTSHQVSKRGGELYCELVGSRVRIAGHAVTFSHGVAMIPTNA